ncbi:copper amine oxidase N-terminal domain-containing protein [Neobacillus mesonae]|nr:copper amine oxidase N-terminal domain-containing protein [Neobacillus mesonae]
MYSTRQKTGAVFIAAVITLSALSANTGTVNAATNVKYEMYLDTSELISGNAILQNGTSYLPLKKIAEQLGVKMVQSGNRFSMAGPAYSLAIRKGSKQAVLNGRSVKLSSAPFLKDKEIYVPAKFLIGALNGEGLEYNADLKMIFASNLNTGNNPRSFGGLQYELTKDGKLQAANSQGMVKQLYDFNLEVYNPYKYEFTKTNEGLFIVSIYDMYGEPMVQQRIFTVIIKNGAVIRQSHVNYFKRFEENAVVSISGNELLLTDGIKLRLLEDGTGGLVKTYNLEKLGGETGHYSVEAVDEEYFLIRSNVKGLLTYIDRETGERVPLYKELLPAVEQEYAESNDVPYYGDEIHFKGRQGDTLEFTVKEGLSGKVYTKTWGIP